MRMRRRPRLLQITSFTLNAGSSLIINVGPITLNDGYIYRLDLYPGIALPPGVIGTEAVQILPSGLVDAIPVGDRRARVLRAERIHLCEYLCMRFTQDSIITAPGATAAEPAFIVTEGLEPLR
jgi:hypothetical protein